MGYVILGLSRGLGSVSVNPRQKLTPGLALLVYVGAFWGQGLFFSYFGGGSSFEGILVGVPPFRGGDLESNLALFSPYLGNLGQFGGHFGWSSPPFGG